MALDLADVASEDLAALLAASASTLPASKTRRKLGGREAPGNDGWVSVPGVREVHLTRSRRFTVSEGLIFEPYGRALRDLSGVPDAVARAARSDILPRAIAVQIGGSGGHIVEASIRFLMEAATATYEGQAVSMSIAMDLGSPSPTWAFPDLEAYSKYDWHAVLGSGAATAIMVDQQGRVVRLVDMHELMSTASIPSNALAPDAFRYLGAWVSAPDRLAVTLTRGREILVQQEGSLKYVYRSGRWKSLPVVNATSIGWCKGARISPIVKTAVLASAIDASLAHHGACISIVAQGHVTAFNAASVVDVADRWPNVRAGMFKSTNFLSLTRRERVELLSMDGATVLSRDGEILAAGAIVKVPGGSSGGGRLAATLALAKFGAALKVSQDGPIRLFGRDSAGNSAELMTLA